MAEETIKVEETTAETANQETNDIDYDKELEIAAEKQRNSDFASKRIAKKAEKEVTEDDDLADRVAAKLFPKLQATAESSALEVKLDKVAGNNESLKKLVKFHFDNSVNPNMDMNERVEAAYAIANKKTIERTAKEINIARTNRSQISNVGQGSNQETQQRPKQNILSDAQIQALRDKAISWHLNPDKFVDETIKRMSGAAK